MINDPITPDEMDAAFGLRPGEVRGWIDRAIIPAGLTGRPLERAVVAAMVSRPALAADRLTVRQYAARRDEITAAWAAQVRASIARATEAACTPLFIESRDPAAGAGVV